MDAVVISPAARPARPHGKRRAGRRVWIVALTLAWTFAPFTPITLCSLAQAAQAADTAPMPDCHRQQAQDLAHAGASAAADAAGGRTMAPCCDDVTTSCCLEAASITGTLSASQGIDRDDSVATLAPLVVTAPLAEVESRLIVLPPQRGGPPPQHSVLLL